MGPGCDIMDGISIANDACYLARADESERTAAIITMACNAVNCAPAGISAGALDTLRLACVGGGVVADYIRCTAMHDLCMTERKNAMPICPGDNPCPFAPSVAACTPEHGPRSETDITVACVNVVNGYGVHGAVHSQCMADCVGTTIEASLGCFDDDLPELACVESGGGEVSGIF
jgi:hypothetical protein